MQILLVSSRSVSFSCLGPKQRFDVSLHSCLWVCDSGEFQAFATAHPEYAKLFTTYLELQRYHALKEARPEELASVDETSSEENEDSTSDKKDD